MKRQLSLVLALVMILGSFTSVFAAEMPTTEVDKAKFLGTKGVLKGNQYGELKLEDNLKRRDAVVLLSRLYGVEAEAKATNSDDLKFEDITDDFYKGFIAWSVKEDIVEGFSATEFAFNKDVKAQDYATMLLRVLKHDVNGDTYTKALVDAEAKGILEGLKDVENMTTTTRGMAATMTFNALGVEVKGTGKTLAETLGIEMPEPPAAKDLTAEVNDTENLKEVVLELSNAKLVDADKLANVNNYKVVDNKVLKATVEDNNVIILLEKAFLDGREYKLRVRSIDKAINKEYKFIARDNTLPTIEEVVVLGEYGIKVITNEPIDIYEGTDRGRNFVVDGKNIAMNVESYGREIILTPYAKETFKDAKTLTVTALADFAGFKTGKESFDLEVVKDEVAPKVEDVILRSDKVVEVVFDKDVYVDSVDAYYDRNNVGNISYLSGRHTIFADKATKVDTNKVRYEFKEEFLRTRTDFTIVDVTNHSKVAMEKTTMVAREILDNVEPEIIEKKISREFADQKAKITLRFDKDVTGLMKTNSAVDKNKNEIEFDALKHVGLYERDVLNRNNVSKDHVVSVKYLVEKDEIVKDTIVVELKDLKEWKTRDDKNYNESEMDYILEIERFASGRNEMYRDYYEFKFTKATGFNVKEVAVDERRNETHITLEFSKKVDRAIAEDETNYIFTNTDNGRKDVKDLKGRIVTEKNGYEVTLILPDFKVSDYKTLRILDTLKDVDGNRLNTTTTYNFVSDVIENNTLYSVVYNDVTKVYEVTAAKDVKEITLKTNAAETFVIKSDLDKLVIDAPNAHVIIDSDVTEVEVKAIGRNSLEINGAVENLVISTSDVVRVYGQIKDMIITSTVKEAKVILNKIGNTAVTIEKGEVKVVIDNDGKIDNADLQAGAKAELVKVKNALTSTSSGAIELEVEAKDREDKGIVTKALQTKLQLAVDKAYEVVVSKVELTGNQIKALITVTETKDTNNKVESLEVIQVEFK